MLKEPVGTLLFLFLFWGTGRGQTLQVQAITVADGLSQGFVSSLLEDRRGFIWIGTFYGLNRYDGYQIKRFNFDNTSRWSLRSNFIHDIAEDTQGLLWLGTDKGPVIFDPWSERFFPLADIAPALPAGNVDKIIAAADGRIWLSHRQPGETGVCVLHPPADLIRLIREDRISGAPFGIQSVRLSEGMAGPLQLLDQINDSILLVLDAHAGLCRIDLVTLLARTVDLRTLPYQRVGNHGLVYSHHNRSGFVFQLGGKSGKQMGDRDPILKFLQLPDENLVLLPWGDVTLRLMDTLLPGLQIPKYSNRSFLLQFKPLVGLDRATTNVGMVDRSGHLWLGTGGYGVRKISRQKLDFKQYLSHKSIYNFNFLPGELVWPGIYSPKEVLNLRSGRLEPAPWLAALPKDIAEYNILTARNGDWWMTARRNDSLVVLKKEKRDGRWRELSPRLTLYLNIQVQMQEDRQGNIWIAGNDGQVVRIHPAGNQVEQWRIENRFPAHPAGQLRSTSLVEDGNGTLWIGYNYGLVQVHHPQGKPEFQVYHDDPAGGALFSNDWILSLYPDPLDTHLIWLGTQGGGLNCFNTQTNVSKKFTEADGLINNVVYGILPDSFGYLWLSTNRGLSRFNPLNHTFANFQNAGPELNTEYNTGAYRALPSGELAFGSTEGLFLIRPTGEQPAERPALVAVTNIEINGQPLDFSCDDGRLLFKPGNALALRLPSDQNNVAIEFAALQTSDPSILQYRYRVKGLSGHWIETGRQRSANLVGLPPGGFVLELQAKAPDGNWDSAPVSNVYLTILPPWYRSWPAYLVYALLGLLLFRLYVHFVRKQLALEHAVALSHKETEQLKALDDFKNRFFAYISHEFKTPLTIILGLAGRLARETAPVTNAAHARDILQQGQNMLELVDQIMDIARLDEQQLRPQWRQGNINHYIGYLVESHRPLADSRQIQLKFLSETPGLTMDFDPLRLKYMLTNLLGNAIRHTGPGGAVEVRLARAGETEVRLDIADTGDGIAPEDIPFIFDRYFQGTSGGRPEGHFGLGLAFVKDLVQLFNGTIGVSSIPGQGATFSITLPIRREAPHWEPIPAPVPAAAPPGSSSERSKGVLPLLLIAEDNPVVAAYFQTCLQTHFRLLFAPDGASAWSMALEQVPDLLLTDVMMPGIDGFELTRRIKTHEMTSHIPVVMLSARSELDDRLSGQRLGADAYLGKPFNEQELLLVLQNLRDLQRRWQERYISLQNPETRNAGRVFLSAQNETDVLLWDAFMLKLYDIFEKNYADEDYGLPQLCRDLEISKSQLQRKLAALSDQPAIELLRRFRLQKARELLVQQPDLTVKQVCFQVGFKDAAHFSRMFSQTFGMAPSEIKNKKL